MQMCLYNLEQAGLIILDDSGIVYFNQVGGLACLQASAQGYFVPISGQALDMQAPTLDVMLSHATKDAVGISPMIADDVNRILINTSSSDRYEVDLNRLESSCEAWIFLKVYPSGEYSNFSILQPFYAVLTWPNSD